MMNSCCTLFHIDPEEVGTPVQLEEEECSGCNCHCGYIQFESLAPDMPKLTSNYTQDEDHLLLEAKIRQQIVQISRLFDVETQVEPGTYSKAHYKIIKVYGDGSRYLKIPEFVPGTLELYTQDGYLINPNSYIYKDGLLILHPCEPHTTTCGCTSSCGIYNSHKSSLGWSGCLQVKAKFGRECADFAVQKAVRDFLIEDFTFGNIKEQLKQGITVARHFRVPHSWKVLVEKYLQDKRRTNYFAFA